MLALTDIHREGTVRRDEHPPGLLPDTIAAVSETELVGQTHVRFTLADHRSLLGVQAEFASYGRFSSLPSREAHTRRSLTILSVFALPDSQVPYTPVRGSSASVHTRANANGIATDS